MQSKLIRAFVLTLSLAGFGAASYVAQAHASTSVSADPGDGNGITTPTCPPNDPNACGID